MSASNRKLSLPATQRGMSFIGVFVIVAVAAFLGMFAFKVGPHYVEYKTVSAIANDLAGNTEMLKKPKSQVMAHINRAYRTNNLWDLKAEDTIELVKNKQRGYVVNVKYEKRSNLIHNIDVVSRFESEASAH